MWQCIKGCLNQEVIASIPESEAKVMIDADTGKSTNYYHDGIKGVIPEHVELAEADESPACPKCFAECDWVDNTSEISNYEDVIDSRDVTARIAQLERERKALSDTEDWDSMYGDELNSLRVLEEDAKPLTSEWDCGAFFIRDSYFMDYAQETAKDIGAIQDEMAWPCNCIDWEKAAAQLQMDYTEVQFMDVTYWLRD